MEVVRIGVVKAGKLRAGKIEISVRRSNRNTYRQPLKKYIY